MYNIDLYPPVEIPAEIGEMARKIENWFKMNGMEKWEFMGICSRNHMDDIRALEKELRMIEN